MSELPASLSFEGATRTSPSKVAQSLFPLIRTQVSCRLCVLSLMTTLS